MCFINFYIGFIEFYAILLIFINFFKIFEKNCVFKSIPKVPGPILGVPRPILGPPVVTDGGGPWGPLDGVLRAA